MPDVVLASRSACLSLHATVQAGLTLFGDKLAAATQQSPQQNSNVASALGSALPSGVLHGGCVLCMQFRSQANPFASLAEWQLRSVRSYTLRSQRSGSSPTMAASATNHLFRSSPSRNMSPRPPFNRSNSRDRDMLANGLSRTSFSGDQPSGLLTARSSSAGSPESCCFEIMDYAASLHLLGILLADGRVALCRTSEAGLAPAGDIEFSHWVCGPGSGEFVGTVQCTALYAETLLLNG